MVSGASMVRADGCKALQVRRSRAISASATSRRHVLATTSAAIIASGVFQEEAHAFLGLFEDKGPKLPPNVVMDRTLAYSFTYPVVTATGKDVPIVASRKPEKYSSAAPLVADARQRIVAEYVSLAEGITYSMFVGPATAGLQKIPEAQWTTNNVATVVLSDRSANRNYAGQKIPVANVEDTQKVERDGVTYYVYETSQAGSPTLYDPSKDTLRLGLSVTAARPGLEGTPFLYTLALSCPSTRWNELEGGFRECINSFTLLTPGDGYVPPDKDPWNIF